ncbi:Hypothetical predicted protein [Pelobates cultripes]|uniref:Uncharacterized protein n=1 Tax=Pelobates cultripes TaxID=61616 RepID=A0AAD1R516_PELCU|nr:Hypothetical predicted protein [Pelobates cultripes]
MRERPPPGHVRLPVMSRTRRWPPQRSRTGNPTAVPDKPKGGETRTETCKRQEITGAHTAMTPSECDSGALAWAPLTLTHRGAVPQPGKRKGSKKRVDRN